jgi:hypothetical protein
MSFVVSVFNEFGALQFSAEFPTPKAVQQFTEWRIEELLDNGAKHLVVFEAQTRTKMRYCASGVADCIFLGTDWRQAIVANAA